MMRKFTVAALALYTISAFAQQSDVIAPPVSQHIVCEHAAPPPGSHWVCDQPDHPCQCHLESNIPGRPILGEGGIQPSPSLSPVDKASGTAACKSVSVRRFVAPFYPETARLGQIQGTVTAYAKLDNKGRVVSVFPEGPPQLYACTVGTLRQWTFHNPQKVKGVTVIFNYKLQWKSLTTDTPPTDISAELPCEVTISSVPEPPPGS